MAVRSDRLPVGVVVVVYGERALAPVTVRELQSAAGVVVVRNPRGPDDAVLASPVPGAVARCLPTNQGYAAAADAGLEEIGRRWPDLPLAAVVTGDVVLTEGCLARLCAAMDDERWGAVGPALVHSDGAQATYGATCSPTGRVRHLTGPWPAEGVRVVDWMDGAVIVLRRSALAAVGDFDASTFLYAEEVDLCARLRRHGHLVGVVADAAAEQTSGMASRPGAHAYLLVRNNIWMSARVAGRRGRWAALGRGLAQVGKELAKVVVRRTDHGARHHLRQAAGAAWGVLDGARGHMGPPPTRLRAWGDIAGVEG